jgi:CheY-like chemotaxis protein
MAKTAKESQTTYSVLLADDSDADRALIRQALRDNPRLKLVGEASDGVEAIASLSRVAELPAGNQPDLLLLDLRMPRKTGYEVLEWLQKQNFKKMLVVVLAGSDLPEDYKKSLDLGAHAYYVKIPQREARMEMIRSIETLLAVAREGDLLPAK